MTLDIPTLLPLIPALPLAAALVTAALGPRLLRHHSHWPAVVAVAASCVASLLLTAAVARDARHERIVTLWTWATVREAAPSYPRFSGEDAGELGFAGSSHRINVGPPTPPDDFRVEVVLRADPLTAVMLCTVTFISLLVIIYSIGYMHGDPGYWRFFSYVSLFVFSMTMLASVSNFVLLYVFWEAVGLCSYLLIGFWYQKPAAAKAAMKAFLVTRVGDFGFALGVFLLWTTYGTLNFHDTYGPGEVTAGILGGRPLASGTVGTAICLLLFAGACGKSAQFPLHVWLPDAMEGPSPVSALIHAATMVTAGVYLVARCSPLFAASADARLVVASIGAGTALMAAIIALTQTDLKRILAYSTISQLGYMFLALGTGTLAGVTAGMFHLVTHAFFKALLFLGAGSVMHAMGGVIDLRRVGGLRHRMPVTHWTFLFGCLALAGIVPFAGFWSKDEILAAVADRAVGAGGGGFFWLLYGAGLLTALLTAVYAFRAFFLTFYGEERIPEEAGQHAHESPDSMTGPLVILALGALVVGAYFQWSGDFLSRDGFLAQTSSLAGLRASEIEPPAGMHVRVAVISTVAALGGVLAATGYLSRRRWSEATAAVCRRLRLYALSQNKFYIDEFYRAVVVRPLEGLSRVCAWFDDNVIDGLVDGCGRVPAAIGWLFRPLHGGQVQFYAAVMMLGLLAMIAALLL